MAAGPGGPTPRRTARLLTGLGQEGVGADRLTAAGVELEVRVVALGVTGHAGQADDLALADPPRDGADDLEQVHVDVGVAVVALEEDHDAAAAPGLGLDRAVDHGHVRRAPGVEEIVAHVAPSP